MHAIEDILKSRFQLSTFRTGQREVLQSILGAKDALAVMPTGGGKSLCYQLPSQVVDGIVVVVSPLISLMEDQVRKLQQLGMAAGFVHSGQTMAEKQALFAQIRAAKNFILYLSPERVQKDGFSRWIAAQNISLFAIDEAHCLSQWGPDFREDYYRLNVLRELRPEVPILALTASATPQVLKDIVSRLGLKDPDRHIYGFYRPNLYYQVEVCEGDREKKAFLHQSIKQNPSGRILIYCGTRKQSEEIAAELGEGIAGVGCYHAGMSGEERTRIQTEFEQGDLRILAATNAFGMGVDHPDVRLVVHFQMPANVENYYQEMGRAGRDGNPSVCLMLYSKKDKGLHSYFIQKANIDEKTTQRRWNALNTMILYVEGGECRHAGILTYFKDTFRLKACGHCDICDPKSDRRVVVESWTAVPKTKKRSSKTKGAAAEGKLGPEEEVRYEVMRAWRKEYAEQNDIPAFIVFSNKALSDLARRNPKTLDALREVYGFGDHKVEHLGSLILERLRDL